MRPDAADPHERSKRLRIAAVVLVLMVGCAGAPLPLAMVGSEPQPAAAISTGEELGDLTSAYRLGSGDKLRVIVFGEEDLSGEFEVDDMGTISLPLIGQITARDRTARDFEQDIEEMLRDGYLNDPRANVEVLNYRPFYIIGEVEEGGEYSFVSGMHVLSAVALAGGYTYRAHTGKVFITRRGQEHEFRATSETRVQPGDVIRVPERFF